MHVANHILLMCSTFGIKYFVVIGIMLNHSPRCADTDQQINNQRIIMQMFGRSSIWRKMLSAIRLSKSKPLHFI